MADFDYDKVKATFTEAEDKLKGAINIEPPKVDIKLPRMSAPSGEGEGYQKVDEEAGTLAEDAEDALDETKSAIMDKILQFKDPIMALLISTFTTLFALNIDKLFDLFGMAGNWISKMQVYFLYLVPFFMVCVNQWGVYRFWDKKSSGIFTMINSKISQIKSLIGDQIDRFKDKIMELVGNIVGQIDEFSNTAKEQVFGQIEGALSKAPAGIADGIEMPDIGDLSAPVKAGVGKLESAFGEAKSSVDEKVDDMIPNVIDDRKTFKLCIVIIPMVILVVFGLVMVFIKTTPPSFDSVNGTAQKFESLKFDSNNFMSRNTERLLLGSLSDIDDASKLEAIKKAANSVSNSPASSADNNSGSTASLDQTEEYAENAIHHLISQIISIVTQIALAFVMAQKWMIRKLLNFFIGKVEGNVNDQVNSKISDTFSEVFDSGLSEVRDKSNAIFDKAHSTFDKVDGVMDKLGPILEAAKKAAALAGKLGVSVPKIPKIF